MKIKQISVNVDNLPGKMLAISQLLGTERINIRAVSVASTTDISTIRLIVDDPIKTANVLNSNGFTVKEAEVIAVEVPDHPGGLQAILKPLKTAGVNIPYMYSHLGRAESGSAVIIIGVDNAQKAIEALEDNWVHILNKEVYAL